MQERRTRKKWIWWVVVPLALLALGAAALYLLGSGGASARYDASESVLADYDASGYGAFTLAPDGTAQLRLDREDLYWAAERYGLLDAIRQGIAERCGKASLGFRLTEGKVIVYLRSKALGILPLSYTAEIAPELSPDGALALRPVSVSLGRRIPLSRRVWPALFENDISVPLGEMARGVRSLHTEGDELVVELEGLSRVFSVELTADEGLLTAVRFFLPAEGGENSLPALLAGLPEAAVSTELAMGWALSAEDPRAAATELLSYCTAASAEPLLENADPLTRDVLCRPLIRAAGELRDEMDERLAAEQSRYEKLLTAVREMYKSAALAIGENGFYNAATGESVDAGTLSRLSATATDSRIVFLYTTLNSSEICLEDMPPVTEAPRAEKTAMQDLLDPERVYDLGVVLTTEGGVPALLHRRRDGAFALRELPETVYVSVLVSQSNPVLRFEDLPPCPREAERPCGEGWNGCVIQMPKTEE